MLVIYTSIDTAVVKLDKISHDICVSWETIKIYLKINFNPVIDQTGNSLKLFMVT